MKTIARSLTLLAAVTITAIGIAAQDQRPVSDVTTQPVPKDRAEMLRLLNLTPDQLRQLRRINVEHKQVMEPAQERLRIANKALDEAIYADNASETDVQARIKEAHEAQADVVRIRSMNEFAIRRLLTPDQLVKFRLMRQRFEEARQNAAKAAKMGPARKLPPPAIRRVLQQQNLPPGIRPPKN